MQECGLKQKDLADVLGVTLDRVKSLTSGKVKKFDPDETRRLVQTLNLNAHWLATGTGAMFNPHGGEQLGAVLTQLKLSSARVLDLGLKGDDAQAARDIATGVAAGNLAMVQSALEVLRHKPPPDEQVLLDCYRRCPPESKGLLIKTAGLLSADMAAPTGASPPSPSASSHNQVNTAPGAIQVRGSGNTVLSHRKK